MDAENLQSKFLGEGSYGCVVKPPVKCKNKVQLRKEKKKEVLVGKIFTNKDSFKKEIIANQNIINIDKKGDKLLSATSYCSINGKELKNINRVKSCEFKHKNIIDKNQPLYQLNMPYGGMTLKEYLKLNKYNINIYDILKLLVNIFKILILLEKKKMCHQDIKPDNILIKPSNESTLIDYGLMIPYDKIYNVFNRHRLKYSYYPYPPEYKFFEFIYFQKCYKYEYCNYIYNNFINSRSSSSQINHTLNILFSQNDVRNIIINKVNNLIEHDKNKTIENYMIKYSNKVDVFSLGMTIVKILKYINYNFEDDYVNTFIRNLIHPDFNIRYSPKEALNNLKILLKKIKN